MRLWPRLPPELFDEHDDALGACNRAIASVRAKANHNERVARVTTGAIILASALIPVCLIASEEGHQFLWGKLLPGVLALISAVAATVLQFERPHERWRLYRGYQRRFEDGRFRYASKLSPYDVRDGEERTRVLAQAVSRLGAQLHVDWSGLVPASSSVAASTSGAALTQATGTADEHS